MGEEHDVEQPTTWDGSGWGCPALWKKHYPQPPISTAQFHSLTSLPKSQHSHHTERTFPYAQPTFYQMARYTHLPRTNTLHIPARQHPLWGQVTEPPHRSVGSVAVAKIPRTYYYGTAGPHPQDFPMALPSLYTPPSSGWLQPSHMTTKRSWQPTLVLHLCRWPAGSWTELPQYMVYSHPLI